MAVPLEVEEIAVGDYSPEYGTVTKVTPSETDISLEFINKEHSKILPKGTQMLIEQGGRFAHPTSDPVE